MKGNENIETNTFPSSIIIIEFDFEDGGCLYTVFATIDTDAGTGAGYIEQNCNGKKRKKWFRMTRVIVVRQITPSNFIDWEDEYGNPTEPFSEISPETISQKMNENWPE